MYSETLDTSLFKYQIQGNNQLIIHIFLKLEMLVVRVRSLENTSLEEHVSSFPFFMYKIAVLQYRESEN